MTLAQFMLKGETPHGIFKNPVGVCYDINPNGFQMTKDVKIYESKPTIFSDFSEYFY